MRGEEHVIALGRHARSAWSFGRWDSGMESRVGFSHLKLSPPVDSDGPGRETALHRRLILSGSEYEVLLDGRVGAMPCRSYAVDSKHNWSSGE